MGGPDSKISTVDVESGDNMATLPVSRAHTSSTDTAEKNNAANKEMELKNVMPKPLERYFLQTHTSNEQTNHSADFINLFLFVFCSFVDIGIRKSLCFDRKWGSLMSLSLKTCFCSSY